MKKDKDTHIDTDEPHVPTHKDGKDTAENEDSAAEETPLDSSTDSPSDSVKTEEDMDVLALSAIESTEAVAADGEKVEDPDQEIKIVRPINRAQWWKRRRVLIPAGILILLVVMFVVPVTRYAALGWLWHEDVTVAVTDNRTGNGLKDATVLIGASSAETDSSGVATVKGVPLGYHDVVVKKAHYKEVSRTATVDVFTENKQAITLVATGTVVSLRITNTVSGDSVADAELKSGTSSLGKTSKDGKIAIVIPVNKKQLAVTVTAPSFNVLAADVTDASAQLTLTPTGLVYFLSKQSGKLDIVKTNVDGTERKVIVAGSGSEDDGATSLIASSDWKYAVLKAKRASNKGAGLYLVNTANDSYAVFDDANVDFAPIGWSGHFFLYKTTRSSEQWRTGSMQLKSFNAETGKTIVLDQNESDTGSIATNAAYEIPGEAYVVDGRVVYTKSWTMYGPTQFSSEGKQAVINSVKPDGSDKKLIKAFPLTTTSYIQSRLYRPQGLYFQTASQGDQQKYTYSELVGTTYKESVTLTADFSTNYPTYSTSPNGETTFWSEERDGKQALFVGDKNADNKQELVTKSDFKPYGWLTDTILLLQKNDSELYVTTKEQLKKGVSPVKVSDYHRTTGLLYGYGYGSR